MRKILILYIFIGISFLSFGQSITDVKIVMRGEPSYVRDAQPTLVLKIDTLQIKLDSISAEKLHPDWIERVEVVKDEDLKDINGNKDGVIFIYPKEEKRKKIIELYKL